MTTIVDSFSELDLIDNSLCNKEVDQRSENRVVYETGAELLVCEVVVGLNPYLNRYNAAIKFLTLVAEGKVSIGTETEDPASAAATGFSAKSNPRLFTRAKMRGM